MKKLSISRVASGPRGSVWDSGEAAAGPGVAGAVDDPLLENRAPVPISACTVRL